MKYLFLLTILVFTFAQCNEKSTSTVTNESSNVTDTIPQPKQPTAPPGKELKTPSTSTVVVDKDCIDTTKVDTKRPCPDLYAPVCGCDGKNYSNSCEAQKKGIQKWTEGACK